MLVILPFNIGITSVIHIIMLIVLTSNKSIQWEILSKKRKKKLMHVAAPSMFHKLLLQPNILQIKMFMAN